MLVAYVAGCAYDPDGNETETTSSWLVNPTNSSVLDYGALGDGYYMGHINLMPYTISTATTGGAFFSELAALSGDTPQGSEVAHYAQGAATWLLRNVQENGTIPYFINPPTTVDHTFVLSVRNLSPCQRLATFS